MKKKKIVLLAVLLAAVAGWFLWPSPSEYGTGYSEEQRKLWNERRALFPGVWEFARVRGDVDITFLSRFLGKDAGWTQKTMEMKKQQDSGLEKQQLELANQESRSCPTILTEDVLQEDIPAYHVSRKECLRRARAGDVDACLAMVCIVLQQGNILTWRAAQDVDYWLGKAEDLKHPGAHFLRYFARKMQPESRSTMKLVGNIAVLRDSPCPDYTGFPGYEDFMTCLRSGDLMAYRLLVALAGNLTLPDRERLVLLDALRTKAQAGDTKAMEKIAELVFSFPRDNEDRLKKMFGELENSFWSKAMVKLPQERKLQLWNALIWLGVWDAEQTATMKEFREGAEYARKAAQSGSMIAMNWWLLWGMSSLRYFTREDWEDALRYHRILMEHGYIPFVRRKLWESFPKPIGDELVACFYPPAALRKSYDDALEKLKLKEEASWFCFDKLTSEIDVEQARRELDERISTMGADFVLLKLIKDERCWNVAPEIARMYASRVKELADEGDPLALLVLGYLNEYGRGMPRDLNKAWNCYSAAKDAVGSYGCISVSYPDPTDGGKYSSSYLQFTPTIFMLSLGIRHADELKKDGKELYDLVQSLDKPTLGSRLSDLSYLLGRIYEDGIGTPVDKEKALSCYKRGGNHAGCSEGAERLLRQLEDDESSKGK